MGGFGKVVGKVVGYGTGITPTKKLFGLDPRDPNADLYNNPYSQKFIQADLNQANAYNNPSQFNREIAGYNPMIAQLQAATQGIGPSLVQGQLQQGTNRNLAQALGFAATNRGVSSGLAARLAGQNVAQINQQGAFDASQARMAEQMAAYQQLLAARNAQLSGTLGGNELGYNYRAMAQDQAERDRQARMALGGAQTSAYESAMGRRLNFLSKAGQGLAAIATGGGSTAASGLNTFGGQPAPIYAEMPAPGQSAGNWVT